jgi:hypothetical protein
MTPHHKKLDGSKNNSINNMGMIKDISCQILIFFT